MIPKNKKIAGFGKNPASMLKNPNIASGGIGKK